MNYLLLNLFVISLISNVVFYLHAKRVERYARELRAKVKHQERQQPLECTEIEIVYN